MDLRDYVSGYYGKKDSSKFEVCTKLISRGVDGSSSHRYSRHPLCNTGNYNESDIVGISVNGKRKGRIGFDKSEIIKAAESGIKGFVTDNQFNRNRSFNIGEQELSVFLVSLGYQEFKDTGKWIKK